MKWSWKIMRVSGIDVYMHATFLILLGWVGVTHYIQRFSMADAWSGMVFIVALFAVVIMHELGHALMARRFGIRTRDIALLPIGGFARLERMPDDPGCTQRAWRKVKDCRAESRIRNYDL